MTITLLLHYVKYTAGTSKGLLCYSLHSLFERFRPMYMYTSRCAVMQFEPNSARS